MLETLLELLELTGKPAGMTVNFTCAECRDRPMSQTSAQRNSNLSNEFVKNC